MTPNFGILSCSYSVPPAVRHNDDPIFARLHLATGWDTAATFPGVESRHVLAEDEMIEDHMARACVWALDTAGIAAPTVDRIYGYASVPGQFSPNGLYVVHREVGLREGAWVVPVNLEYSTFLASLVLASEAGALGRCRYALVTCGSNWSRHLDYAKGHAFAAGDAAGAAVLGPHAPLVLTDHATRVYPHLFQALTMAVRPVLLDYRPFLLLDREGTPQPVYRMDDELGPQILHEVLRDGLTSLITSLLNRNGIASRDITLITHQGSADLIEHWQNQIRPGVYAQSLRDLGNMTSATYPVNLARILPEPSTPFIVLAAPGTGAHLLAVLLRRR